MLFTFYRAKRAAGRWRREKVLSEHIQIASEQREVCFISCPVCVRRGCMCACLSLCVCSHTCWLVWCGCVCFCLCMCACVVYVFVCVCVCVFVCSATLPLHKHYFPESPESTVGFLFSSLV